MRNLMSTLAILLMALLWSSRSGAQYISTVAGTPFSSGYAGDNGPATAALMFSPSDIVLDKNGNLLIADFLNNVIRKLDTSGMIHTIAGTGYGAGLTAGGRYTGDGGAATAADLNGPFGIAIDQSGNIFFADGYNHVVRKINATGTISTVAGQNFTGYTGDGGPATAATLNNPVGVAFDRKGNMYIADDHNNAIRRVDTAGIITTFAGNNTTGYSGDGGPATMAALSSPIGVATDTIGNVYIADADNNVVRMVDTLGVIHAFAGNHTSAYSGDGSPATAAGLRSPERITVDDSMRVYISDFQNNVVRRVDPTGIISTYAGIGTGAGTGGTSGAYSGDGGPATAAELFDPSGIAIAKSGLVYICDRNNDIIRLVGPPPPIDHTGIGVLPQSAPGINVYPVPALNGTFFILVNTGKTETVEISIFNTFGQIVGRYSADANRAIQVNTNLPPGVYLISAGIPTGSWTKRIVLE